MDGATFGGKLFDPPAPASADVQLAEPTYTARPYQVEAIERARELIQKLAALLLVLPTGGGKTLIAALVIRGAVAKGKRVVFLAHRREIIAQSFWKIVDAGVPEQLVGVVMADGVIPGRDGRSYVARRPRARVIVASVQTLAHRPFIEADVVFVDEAHHATAGSYERHMKLWREKGAVIVGLTATPERADGRGLCGVFEHLHLIAQPRELIAGGYLSEPAVWAMKVPAGLAGVKLTAGDYDLEELGDVMDCPAITGSVVEQYIKHGGDRTGVIFTVNTAHAKHLAEKFTEAGIPAEDLNGSMDSELRDAILRRLADGTTRIVCNCAVLTEGWDLPRAKYLALARPTRSLSLYLQMAGRVLRPWQGVEPVIVDHGGCVEEHGLPHDDREWSLESKKRGKKATKSIRTCPKCERTVAQGIRECPSCGYVWPALPVPEEMVAEAVRVARAARIAAEDSEERRADLRRSVARAVAAHARQVSAALVGVTLDTANKDLNTTIVRRWRCKRAEMSVAQLEDVLAWVTALPVPARVAPAKMPCVRCGGLSETAYCTSCAKPPAPDLAARPAAVAALTTPESPAERTSLEDFILPGDPVPAAEPAPVVQAPANRCPKCGRRWYSGGVCRRCRDAAGEGSDRPGVATAAPPVAEEMVAWSL